MLQRHPSTKKVKKAKEVEETMEEQEYSESSGSEAFVESDDEDFRSDGHFSSTAFSIV